MLRIAGIIVLIILIPFNLKSQIVPRERSELNYRLVGFTFPAKQGVSNYSLEIATGSYESEDSFTKNTIITLNKKSNKIIAEVPAFGTQYTWRVVYNFGKPGKLKSIFYHFATGNLPDSGVNSRRLRITKQAIKYKDAYVFLDGSKTLYDMKGRPIWYLPRIDGQNFTPLDIKPTPNGTITFLTTKGIYEINYDGDILWKETSGSKSNGATDENYHHEFTKLSNGHYMTLGMNQVSWEQPGNTSAATEQTKDTSSMKTPFGTIIEYDEKGNVVWSWKSSDYFMKSDLINYIPSKGSMDVRAVDVHENSFFFDEKNKTIYVSFKNISRIVKIKYPDGTVTNVYGEIYKPGTRAKGNGFFCDQHSVKRSGKGCVFLFNNNDCGNGIPKIKIFKEPLSKKDLLKIIWEYQCTVEGESQKSFVSGGSVIEMPDHSIFVSMGSNYGKTFIVNPEKKILWSALSEKWVESEKKWIPCGQYRASIIENRKGMEQLIWNSTTSNTAVVSDHPAKSKPELTSIMR